MLDEFQEILLRHQLKRTSGEHSSMLKTRTVEINWVKIIEKNMKIPNNFLEFLSNFEKMFKSDKLLRGQELNELNEVNSKEDGIGSGKNSAPNGGKHCNPQLGNLQ